jgi:hypothetical protein
MKYTNWSETAAKPNDETVPKLVDSRNKIAMPLALASDLKIESYFDKSHVKYITEKREVINGNEEQVEVV